MPLALCRQSPLPTVERQQSQRQSECLHTRSYQLIQLLALPHLQTLLVFPIILSVSRFNQSTC